MRAPILVDNVEDLGALNAMLCAFTCTEVLRSIVERQGATQLSYMNLAAWKTFVVPESHPARDCRVYSPAARPRKSMFRAVMPPGLRFQPCTWQRA